jgi:hypothetical protein
MGKCSFDAQMLEMNKSGLFSIGCGQGRAERGRFAEDGANRSFDFVGGVPNDQFNRTATMK